MLNLCQRLPERALKSIYSRSELDEIYTPIPEARIWVGQNTRGDMANLGLLVSLKIPQRPGYFVPERDA